MLWGLALGAVQAASPLILRWLEAAVAFVFVLVATVAVTATAWLLVIGYAGHGLKDYWQHRRQYVANTRWWPPFCAAVDWLVALVVVAQILAGVDLHR